MANNEDYIIEDLISQSEQLLDGLELPETDAEREVLDKAQIDFFNGEIEGNSFSSDGFIKIRISDDKMTAYADFHPPTSDRSAVSYGQTVGQLAEIGIVFGLQNDDIQKYCLECFTENRIIDNVIVAIGEEPVPAIPEYYLIDSELLNNKKQLEEKGSRVDYKKSSPFVLVKKGQLVAKIIDKKEGIPGHNILGEEIPYPKQIKNKLQPGHNLFKSENKIFSAKDGLFKTDDILFFVDEVLQIETGVDYSTGDIDFPGDVLIKGETKDGFKVKAGGRIYYTGTFDASFAECKDDLIVTQGIIGRKKGKIKSGGSIEAKFIENCFVESIKDIKLISGIMNSEVYSNGKVHAGEKGVLIGGTVYAQNGIVAKQIGSAMGPRTEVYCGTDFIVQSKLLWARDHSMDIAMKLNKVNNQIKKSTEPDPRLHEVQGKLANTLKKINDMSNKLIFELHKNEDADVIVLSNIYPGVYIEICHFSYIVDKVLGPTRFYLDKRKGVITAEKYRL